MNERRETLITLYMKCHTFFVRRLACSYKKSSVKGIALIFDEFTRVVSQLSCRSTFEKFLSYKPEASEGQAFSRVLLQNPCRFITVAADTEIMWSIA